jgi:hypothetical protein
MSTIRGFTVVTFIILILSRQKRTIRGELMSIATHEVNEGEELINIKYFSFHFNFPEKKEAEWDARCRIKNIAKLLPHPVERIA